MPPYLSISAYTLVAEHTLTEIAYLFKALFSTFLKERLPSPAVGHGSANFWEEVTNDLFDYAVMFLVIDFCICELIGCLD